MKSNGSITLHPQAEDIFPSTNSLREDSDEELEEVIEGKTYMYEEIGPLFSKTNSIMANNNNLKEKQTN